MAINLQKPLQTDVYNVDVFNTNAETIQVAVNGLLTDVDSLNAEIIKKLPYTQVNDGNFDINTALDNGIYYINVIPSGTLPDDVTDSMMILLSIKNTTSNQSTQILFTSNGTHYRTVNDTTVNSWLSFKTINVINSLTSNDTNSALSANQGKILNESKLGITYYTTNDTINIDTTIPGIFICNQTTVTGTVPSITSISTTDKTKNKFIIESYGNTSLTICLQRICDTISGKQCTRYGFFDTNNNFIWSQWKEIGSDSGGGGGSSDIQLEIVDL